MDIFLNTIGVLGTPVAVSAPVPHPKRPLTVARWRHGDAELELGSEDAVGLVLTLSDEHRIERRWRGTWAHKPSCIGRLTVADPNEATQFRIRGTTDVVQLFVPMMSLQEQRARMNNSPFVLVSSNQMMNLDAALSALL
ncbi:hypothetical protein [uncultured Enterovirga sp.]|uniref:hypothetical protein n=1 Tax=uncultured Enterovirga sp. TaxID=2026352 RepID=UPI0035CB88DC